MTELAPDRLARLLALIAYLEENPGVPVAAVADHFGVSREQVIADVNTLWVSGAPGYLHGDLIDFSADEYDRGVLTLTDDQSMSRPLRLGPAEAAALLVALRSVEAVIGPNDLVATTSAKLQAAAGDAARLTDAVRIEVGEPGEYRELLAEAIARDRRVRLTYISATEEESVRDVDPRTLLTDGARWYLDAWCHRAGAPRQFRLDRITAATLLETRRADHETVPVSGPWVPEGARVRLRLASRARWVADRLPHLRVSDHDDATFTLEIAVAEPAWLRRLSLELGADLRRIEPETVAREVAAAARSALAAYASYDSPGTRDGRDD